MSNISPDPTTLLQEIESYLKGDSLEQFHKILASVNEKQNDAETLYNQIFELIQGNEKLRTLFEEGIESSNNDIDAVAALALFIQVVNTNLKTQTNFLPQFTHAIALFVNELIPLQYFENRIHQLASPLSLRYRKTIEQELSKLINKIRSADQENFFRAVREDVLKSVSEEFVVNPNYSPSLLMQMMVIIGCSCNVDQINYVFRALKLYASDLMPIDAVYHYIQPINITIAQIFEEAAQTEKIENFYPLSIFESMKKDFSTPQLKWALGDTLYDILNTQLSSPNSSLTDKLSEKLDKFDKNSSERNEKNGESPPSILQLAQMYKEDFKKQKDRNEAATIPYIAEMRCAKMLQGITAIVNSLRADNYSTPPTIPSNIVDSVFGSTKFDQSNDAFYSVFINTCLEIGSIANKQEIHFLDQKLLSYNPSSNDWRCTFKYKVTKRYMTHTLFFNGRKIQIDDDEIIKVVARLLKKFSQRFTDLENSCEAFLKMMDGGEYELNEFAAFTVFCYFEIIEMVQTAQSTNYDFTKLADRVWEETSPLANFDGLSIANIDIVLKYFARYLNMAYKNPSQFENNNSDFASSGIAYHLSAKDNVFEIGGYINPVFDLTFP